MVRTKCLNEAGCVLVVGGGDRDGEHERDDGARLYCDGSRQAGIRLTSP